MFERLVGLPQVGGRQLVLLDEPVGDGRRAPCELRRARRDAERAQAHVAGGDAGRRAVRDGRAATRPVLVERLHDVHVLGERRQPEVRELPI